MKKLFEGSGVAIVTPFKDGKINYDYLKLTNRTEEDVISLIKKEGYNKVEEIFMAQELIDELYIVPFKKGNNKK